jgi:hypothetical protein
MNDLESDELLAKLKDMAKAIVEQNKALDARRHDVNIPALRAMGLID